MRIQSFEFMDIPQVPRFMRESIIESVGAAQRWSGIFKNVASAFAEFCSNLDSKTILSLCSGSGETVAILLEELNKKGKEAPNFLISDIFPIKREMEKIVDRFPKKIQAIYTPIDATNVPNKYQHSARAIISSFHHFPPYVAKIR